jgi:hypothetical protein
MMMRLTKGIVAASAMALLVLLAGCGSTPAPASAETLTGAWNITIEGAEGGRSRPAWLEITGEGEATAVRFLPGGGNPFPLKEFSIEGGELKFQHMAGREPDRFMLSYTARVKGDRLEGTVTSSGGGTRSFTGVRPPKWPETPPERAPGESVALFNGKDLSGWVGQNPNGDLGWTVVNGVLTNPTPPADNIYTERQFMDFILYVEFKLEPKSNSGVYLRGRHEVQIVDDYGREPSDRTQGGIYGFLAPAVNASKPAGEWQTMKTTLIGNRVTVELNETKVLDDVVIPAITGGAMDANEGEPGPILLQGDHGQVHYRQVVLTPLF